MFGANELPRILVSNNVLLMKQSNAEYSDSYAYISIVNPPKLWKQWDPLYGDASFI